MSSPVQGAPWPSTGMSYYYPQIQVGLTEPVIITEVSSPQSLFCQLRSMAGEVQRVSGTMQNFYEIQSGCGEPNFHQPFLLGQPCAALGQDGRWYRSLLLEIIPDRQLAMVIHVDSGRREIVPLTCLRRLAAEFFRMPVVTLRCALYGVSDGGLGWEPALVSELRTLVQGKQLHAKIEFFNSCEHLYMVTLLGENGDNLNQYFNIRIQSLRAPSVNVFTVQTPLPPKENGVKIDSQQLLKQEVYVPRFPTVELLPGTFYDATVEFTLDPSNFWIRTEKDSAKHKQILDSITSIYSKAAKLDGMIAMPELGQICCAKFHDSRYYRAEVVAVEKQHEKKMVKVYFLDHGNCTLVDWCDVKVLPAEFKALPALANKCALVDIHPLGKTWSAEAILSFKVAVIDKRLVVHVVSKVFDKYLIEVLDPSRMEERSVGKILSAAGHVKYEELEMAAHVPGFERASADALYAVTKKQPLSKQTLPKTSQQGANATVSCDDGTDGIQYSPYEEQLFEPGTTAEVYVSHVVDPGLFWCQLRSQLPALTHLMDLIQVHCSSETSPYDGISPVCLAKNPQNDIWYRGFVTEIPVSKTRSGCVEVLYVDYGNKEHIPVANLRAMNSDFFHLKAQAFKCSLYNMIAPKGDNPFYWDSKTITMFNAFILQAEKSNEFHCMFFATALLDNELINIVDLYTPFDSVGSTLVKNGLATCLLHKTLVPSVQLQSFFYSMHDVKIGNEEEIYITHVSPSLEFYCQLSRSTDTLDRISDAITKTCKKIQHLNMPCRGPLCLAKFTDQQWYRGFIPSSNEHSEVFFVDFGNTEKVSKQDLLPIMPSENDLLLLPMQAIKCRLSDTPTSTPKEIACWFKDAVLDKALRAIVVAKETDGKLIIELFDGTEQINAMLKKKLGLKAQKNLEISAPAVQPRNQSSSHFNQLEMKPLSKIGNRENSRPYEGHREQDNSRPYEGHRERESTRSYEGHREREKSRPYEGHREKDNSRPYEGHRERENIRSYEGHQEREKIKSYEGHREDSRPYEGHRERENIRSYEVHRENSRSYEGQRARENGRPYEGHRENTRSYEGHKERENTRSYEGHKERENTRSYEGQTARMRDPNVHLTSETTKGQQRQEQSKAQTTFERRPDKDYVTEMQKPISQRQETPPSWDTSRSRPNQDKVASLDSKPCVQKPIQKEHACLTPLATASSQKPSVTKLNDLPKKQIALGTKLQVYISHTNTVFDFYVQMDTDTQQLDEISETLNGGSPLDDLSEKHLSVGDLVCAFFPTDGLCYRGVVKEKTANGLNMEYIDYGNTSVIPNGKTYSLPKELCSVPAMSIHCSLSDRGNTASTADTEEILNAFLERTSEAELNCEFIKQHSGKWEVVLSDERGCINDLLPPPPEADLVSKCETKQDDAPVIKRFTWNIPQPGKAVNVFISAFDGPEYFWCQLSTADPDFLTEEVHRAGEASTADDHFIAALEVGIPCNVKYSEDRSWYRAVITEMEGDFSNVIFVDYGNSEKVPKDQVRQLPNQLAIVPAQAFPCGLAGFSSDAGSWAAEALDAFVQATEETLELTVQDIKTDEIGKIPLALVTLTCAERNVNDVMKQFWLEGKLNLGGAEPDDQAEYAVTALQQAVLNLNLEPGNGKVVADKDKGDLDLYNIERLESDTVDAPQKDFEESAAEEGSDIRYVSSSPDYLEETQSPDQGSDTRYVSSSPDYQEETQSPDQGQRKDQCNFLNVLGSESFLEEKDNLRCENHVELVSTSNALDSGNVDTSELDSYSDGFATKGENLELEEIEDIQLNAQGELAELTVDGMSGGASEPTLPNTEGFLENEKLDTCLGVEERKDTVVNQAVYNLSAALGDIGETEDTEVNNDAECLEAATVNVVFYKYPDGATNENEAEVLSSVIGEIEEVKVTADMDNTTTAASEDIAVCEISETTAAEDNIEAVDVEIIVKSPREDSSESAPVEDMFESEYFDSVTCNTDDEVIKIMAESEYVQAGTEGSMEIITVEEYVKLDSENDSADVLAVEDHVEKEYVGDAVVEDESLKVITEYERIQGVDENKSIESDDQGSTEAVAVGNIVEKEFSEAVTEEDIVGVEFSESATEDATEGEFSETATEENDTEGEVFESTTEEDTTESEDDSSTEEDTTESEDDSSTEEETTESEDESSETTTEENIFESDYVWSEATSEEYQEEEAVGDDEAESSDATSDDTSDAIASEDTVETEYSDSTTDDDDDDDDNSVASPVWAITELECVEVITDEFSGVVGIDDIVESEDTKLSAIMKHPESLTTDEIDRAKAAIDVSTAQVVIAEDLVETGETDATACIDLDEEMGTNVATVVDEHCQNVSSRIILRPVDAGIISNDGVDVEAATSVKSEDIEVESQKTFEGESILHLEELEVPVSSEGFPEREAVTVKDFLHFEEVSDDSWKNITESLKPESNSIMHCEERDDVALCKGTVEMEVEAQSMLQCKEMEGASFWRGITETDEIAEVESFVEEMIHVAPWKFVREDMVEPDNIVHIDETRESTGVGTEKVLAKHGSKHDIEEHKEDLPFEGVEEHLEAKDFEGFVKSERHGKKDQTDDPVSKIAGQIVIQEQESRSILCEEDQGNLDFQGPTEDLVADSTTESLEVMGKATLDKEIEAQSILQFQEMEGASSWRGITEPVEIAEVESFVKEMASAAPWKVMVRGDIVEHDVHIDETRESTEKVSAKHGSKDDIQEHKEYLAYKGVVEYLKAKNFVKSEGDEKKDQADVTVFKSTGQSVITAYSPITHEDQPVENIEEPKEDLAPEGVPETLKVEYFEGLVGSQRDEMEVATSKTIFKNTREADVQVQDSRYRRHEEEDLLFIDTEDLTEDLATKGVTEACDEDRPTEDIEQYSVTLATKGVAESLEVKSFEGFAEIELAGWPEDQVSKSTEEVVLHPQEQDNLSIVAGRDARHEEDPANDDIEGHAEVLAAQGVLEFLDDFESFAEKERHGMNDQISDTVPENTGDVAILYHEQPIQGQDLIFEGDQLSEDVDFPVKALTVESVMGSLETYFEDFEESDGMNKQADNTVPENHGIVTAQEAEQQTQEEQVVISQDAAGRQLSSRGGEPTDA
ncbi:tudor domain-containing protein 6 isoform X2 [Hyperolius riggenbachi]|uniref:tudor domain-containing protein 6 isoform X2 n=1 Tax=Hyperolius riggenbachi TaxID=752182 RepID=UPI0035A2D4B3